MRMSRISAVLQLGLLVLAADLMLLANPGSDARFWWVWGGLLGLGAILVLWGWRRSLAIEMEWIEDSWYDYAAAAGRWMTALRMGRVETTAELRPRLHDSLDDAYERWLAISHENHLKKTLMRYYGYGQEGAVIAALQTMKQAYHRWARLADRRFWNRPPGFSAWLEQKAATNRPVFELWVYAQCAWFDYEHGLTQPPSFVQLQPLWESWKR